MAPRRVHITGGPGSGKTTMGGRLSAMLGAPVNDLDGLVLATVARLPQPDDAARCLDLVAEEVSALAAADVWVSEGGYLGWTQPFLERADLIVWMGVPWRVASRRILLRHVRAELARDNRFPGWGNLFQFWLWSARYYHNRNQPGLNDYGTPNTIATLGEALMQFEDGVVRCESRANPETIIELVEPGRAGMA